MIEPKPFRTPSSRYPVLLIGPPGVGKGTLARAIVAEMERYDLSCGHISTGDLFRQLPPEHPRASELQALIATGKYVSDEIVFELLSERLASSDTPEVFLLDGMPRTMDQALWVMRAVKPALVIVLDAPEEVLISRLSGRRTHLASGRVYNVNDPMFAPRHEGVDDFTGEPLVQRPEDMPDRVIHRFALYSAQTQRVVSYFETVFAAETSPIVLRVDGTRTTGDLLVSLLPWIKERLRFS